MQMCNTFYVNKAGNILSPAIKKLQVMEHRFLWA